MQCYLHHFAAAIKARFGTWYWTKRAADMSFPLGDSEELEQEKAFGYFERL